MFGCAPQTESSASSQNASEEWDENYDVIIVGSGAAGFSAAVEAIANDSNATIVMLESMSTWGGNSILNQGNYGACLTDVQIAAGKEDILYKDDSPDLYFAEKCKLGDYRMDTKLTRIFVDNCLDGYHWLNDLGVTYTSAAMYDEAIPAPTSPQGQQLHLQFNPKFENGSWIGCQTKGRHHKGAEYKSFTSGAAGMNALYDAAVASDNFTLKTGSAITTIVREGVLSGKAIGVATKDGLRIKANRGIVLAAGGYSGNIDLCRMYDPRIPESASNTGCSGVDGSCLIAAVDAGANTRGLDFIQHTFQESARTVTKMPLFKKTGTYINVDWNGQRFWKETENKAAFRDARVSLLHELGIETWWSIADSAAAESLKLEADAIEKSIEANVTYRADSLEELAEAIGISADNLKATVERWNSFVANGEDEDFGQSADYLRSITTPPFYAEERRFYIHSTPGGICIDENTQVIDRHGALIPGLYAAGEITGGVHGTERNGGCSWTDCVVFGRIAGRHSVKAEA